MLERRTGKGHSRTSEVKEAINKDKKGNAFPLGRNKAFRVAGAQSTGTDRKGHMGPCFPCMLILSSEKP